MRHEDFGKLVEEILQATKDVMISKNAEYAPGDDKLANFKRGAQALGCSPEWYLLALMEKHLTSIRDIVKGDAGYTPQLLREKCGDARNYTILLEALMQERHT